MVLYQSSQIQQIALSVLLSKPEPGDTCKHTLPHFACQSISKSCKFSFVNMSKLLSLFPVFATAAIVQPLNGSRSLIGNFASTWSVFIPY